MSLPLAIAGAAGRMGRALTRAAAARPEFRIVGAAERPGAPDIGADAGALAGLSPIGLALSADVSLASSNASVWIDFTAPSATLAALGALAPGVRAAIIGTTGFDAAGDAAIVKAAERFAVVRSGNFSLGVNLLAALVEQAAARLGADWDIEILEAHHRRKVDAPSGTALLLADAAARGRGMSLDDLCLPPHYETTEARREGGIGFAVVRGGGLVGEHDVLFAAEREVLRLSHQALDRAVFADGALAAALWAADKAPGLYSMRDVLGL